MLIVLFDRNFLNQTKTNVFVKNIPPDFTNKQLYDAFRSFGDIFSCKVPLNYKGQSKGYGYVQFRELSAAEKAMKEMNGKEIRGKKIITDYYKLRETKDKGDKKFTNLYVKNLPPEVTSNEALDNLFKDYGKRTSVGIFSGIFKSKEGDKKGYYGFINFENADDAGRVIAEMNGKEISNVKLFVTKALSKDQYEREKVKKRYEMRVQSRKYTLYVKSNTLMPLSEPLIRAELEQYGEINQVNIHKQKTSDGIEIGGQIAFVVFAIEDAATKVYKSFVLFIGCN